MLLMSCLCPCKDSTFKAIHNYLDTDGMQVGVVSAPAKIVLLKQFTTSLVSSSAHRWLSLPLQR